MELISFAVTAKLICAFVFAYADCWFSHVAAHIVFEYDYNQSGKTWCSDIKTILEQVNLMSSFQNILPVNLKTIEERLLDLHKPVSDNLKMILELKSIYFQICQKVRDHTWHNLGVVFCHYGWKLDDL